MATDGAASARLRADDIACVLFPRGGGPLSEDLLASVRLILRKLVAAIEMRLSLPKAENALSYSWDMLCSSGLLRSSGLIDFCLARIAEREIRLRLEQSDFDITAQLPARLLHSADPRIAETARTILVGENLALLDSEAAYLAQLPAELLHDLAWKTVATLQFAEMVEPLRRQALVAGCKKMLASADESGSLQAAAAKLVYFAPQDIAPVSADLPRAGLSVFVAALAHDLTIEQDMIYRLFGLENPAPSMLLLRAVGQSPDMAFATMCLLRADFEAGEQFLYNVDDLASIPVDDARQIIAGWNEPSALAAGTGQ